VAEVGGEVGVVGVEAEVPTSDGQRTGGLLGNYLSPAFLIGLFGETLYPAVVKSYGCEWVPLRLDEIYGGSTNVRGAMRVDSYRLFLAKNNC